MVCSWVRGADKRTLAHVDTQVKGNGSITGGGMVKAAYVLVIVASAAMCVVMLGALVILLH